MPLGPLCSLALCAGLAAQAPGVVEVIGPAGEPSRALREQLKKGEDELLLFDVGLGVREAVVNLHEEWGGIEHQRARALIALTAAIVERSTRAADPADVAVAHVAGVAHALFVEAAERGGSTEEELAEVAEVEAARSGTMRFLSPPARHDWCDARPRGGYTSDAWQGELQQVFRATVYLRTYLGRWPPELTACWRAHCAACAAANGTAKLGTVDQEMAILFGCGTGDDGLPAPGSAPDVAWLRTNAAADAPVHDRLCALFAAVPMSEPKAMSDGVLRICHALGDARATDPLFGAMAPAQWQAKWRDAAMFAYVGLREVDCLARAVGREDVRAAPRIVVEPLPEVWQALRWFDVRFADLRSVRSPDYDWHKAGSQVDPVLEALAIQQRGEDLPQQLQERLLQMLLWSFEAPDRLLGVESELEGVPTRVRRAEPQLVRVPIVWRGETKKALALRLFVEHQGPDGRWQAVAAAGAR